MDMISDRPLSDAKGAGRSVIIAAV